MLLALHHIMRSSDVFMKRLLVRSHIGRSAGVGKDDSIDGYFVRHIVRCIVPKEGDRLFDPKWKKNGWKFVNTGRSR